MSYNARAAETSFNLESLTCRAYNQTTRQHGETRTMYSFIGVLESGLADIIHFIARKLIGKIFHRDFCRWYSSISAQKASGMRKRKLFKNA